MKNKVITGFIVLLAVFCITACNKGTNGIINWNNVSDESSDIDSKIVSDINSQVQLLVSNSEYITADNNTKEQMFDALLKNLSDQNLIKVGITKSADGISITSIDNHDIFINYDGNITVK